ncbi:hypothetical protein ES703_111815 [subsurface metagenome]
MAWRRFAVEGVPDAIMIVKSTDGGKKFTKPFEAAVISPFDQGSSEISFRTSAFPTMAMDEEGIIYLAWSQRGIGPEDDSRIVLTTSGNGRSWTAPLPIDNHSGRGHQMMPSLTYAEGKLMITWYDFRNDASEQFTEYIAETGLIRHTMDVRVTQGEPGIDPTFGPSKQISRYVHVLDQDIYGSYSVQQAQFNPPNYPLFKHGEIPFVGDYIDIAPSPRFVLDSNGEWRFNTEVSNTSLYHTTWTDNRDVRPPLSQPFDWTSYTPPQSGCVDEYTGMRNQNIYTSRISSGLILGSPGNTKPLGLIQRSFVIFAKNTTNEVKSFRMAIDVPDNVCASFKPFESEECSEEKPLLDTLDISISPQSSISRSVFVESSDPQASITVNVFEISEPGQGGIIIDGGLSGSVVLNPDITNPAIENPDYADPAIENPAIQNTELHNPAIENPAIENMNPLDINIINPAILNPAIDNPAIMNTNYLNPAIENPAIENPNMIDPAIENPAIENQNILNPAILNPAMEGYPKIIPVSGSSSKPKGKIPEEKVQK